MKVVTYHIHMVSLSYGSIWFSQRNRMENNPLISLGGGWMWRLWSGWREREDEKCCKKKILDLSRTRCFWQGTHFVKLSVFCMFFFFSSLINVIICRLQNNDSVATLKWSSLVNEQRGQVRTRLPQNQGEVPPPLTQQLAGNAFWIMSHVTRSHGKKKITLVRATCIV